MATITPLTTEAPNFSHLSEASQTAEEFISSQLQLEADAREALPYQFDTCTYSLGPIRQSLYSCLTCNPLSSDSSTLYSPAGVCYSCSISCHGEHELVELFTRRNFVCDCGTTRLPRSSTCSLRLSTENGTKGGVHSEKPSATNRYNHNFQNRFCGCGEEYDPNTEKGTMFQCLGLGTVEDGGCGEDWWHPECVMGLSRDWYTKADATQGLISHTPRLSQERDTVILETRLETVKEDPEQHQERTDNTVSSETTEPLAMNGSVHLAEGEGHPVPPGFPAESDFEHFICYKCTTAYPWIKRYAGTSGFLQAIPYNDSKTAAEEHTEEHGAATKDTIPMSEGDFKRKRKADNVEDEIADSVSKRVKAEEPHEMEQVATRAMITPACRSVKLPPAPSFQISVFLKPDFREYLCHCSTCFPLLAPHPALLEEEEAYEPPLSSSPSSPHPDDHHSSHHSAGSRSLLDRGEAVLSNMDRVRAIEGVMAYNHLRDKVKDFLKPFAESGTAVGAEDIKKYFEKLRGDEEAIRQAQAGRAGDGEGGEDADARRQQRGY